MQQEVVLARKVIHPNLCPIYEIFHCHHPGPAFLFLSMRLLEGETLHARLAEKKRLDAEDAVSICKQLVAGVSALHDAGVIHRDLKPNNVMLEGEGPDTHVSIMDFGLARLHEVENSMPGSGLIAGTPGYLAPELLSGAKPTRRFPGGLNSHHQPVDARRGARPAHRFCRCSSSQWLRKISKRALWRGKKCRIRRRRKLPR